MCSILHQKKQSFVSSGRILTCAPPICPLCLWCCLIIDVGKWGGGILRRCSARWPLDPLLFCLAIHKMCAKTQVRGDRVLLGIMESWVEAGRLWSMTWSWLRRNRASWAWGSPEVSLISIIVLTMLPEGLFLRFSLGFVRSILRMQSFWGLLWGMQIQLTRVNDKINTLELMGDRLRELHSNDAITLYSITPLQSQTCCTFFICLLVSHHITFKTMIVSFVISGGNLQHQFWGQWYVLAAGICTNQHGRFRYPICGPSSTISFFGFCWWITQACL